MRQELWRESSAAWEQKGFCVVSDCVALCFKWGSVTQFTEKCPSTNQWQRFWHNMSPWIEKVEDNVLQVAHHRSEADVEQLWIIPRSQSIPLNVHVPKVWEGRSSSPKVTDHSTHNLASQKADALMLPSSCLVGSITRMVPSKQRQDNRAFFGRKDGKSESFDRRVGILVETSYF